MPTKEPCTKTYNCEKVKDTASRQGPPAMNAMKLYDTFALWPLNTHL